MGNVIDPGNISYRHGVNLPFNLLVSRQGSLQTFLGVQLRVSALVNVSINTRHIISGGKCDEARTPTFIGFSMI